MWTVIEVCAGVDYCNGFLKVERASWGVESFDFVGSWLSDLWGVNKDLLNKRVCSRDWFECYLYSILLLQTSQYVIWDSSETHLFAVASVMNTQSVMLQLNILLAYPRQLSIVKAFNIIPALLSEFNSIEISSRRYD